MSVTGALGNEHGSRYAVQGVETRAHRPDVAWEPPANTGSDATYSLHYFLATAKASFSRASRGRWWQRFGDSAALIRWV